MSETAWRNISCECGSGLSPWRPPFKEGGPRVMDLELLCPRYATQKVWQVMAVCESCPQSGACCRNMVVDSYSVQYSPNAARVSGRKNPGTSCSAAAQPLCRVSPLFLRAFQGEPFQCYAMQHWSPVSIMKEAERNRGVMRAAPRVVCESPRHQESMFGSPCAESWNVAATLCCVLLGSWQRLR